MKNFRQEGRIVTCTAPAGGVVSGNLYAIGDLTGIAAVTAAEGAFFELAVVGVFTLPKAAGAMAEGQRLYWDATAKAVTTTATNNTFIGHAIGARVSSAATVDVRLSR